MTTHTEQRRQILQMVAEGQISSDEAEQLIDALDRNQPAPLATTAVRTKDRPKYLRVVVNSTDGDGEGPTKVNIRVPLMLLRAGVRLASLIPPQAMTKANAELSRSGVPIDLSSLRPEDLDELIDHLEELTVDVDDEDTTVRIFAE